METHEAQQGDLPQDRNFTGGESYLEIGAGCIIREGATAHRGTQPGSATRIGDGCMLSADGKADGVYANGLVIIRDGVLVVPKNAVLPPGTVV